MILIDNMDIPKTCSECPIMSDGLDHYCILAKSDTDYQSMRTERMRYCPLHEVKPDPDTVSRQAAVDAVEFGITYAKAINKETGEVVELFKSSNDELRKAVDRIKQLPPSPTPSRPHGEWIRVPAANGLDKYRCDKCGHYVTGGDDKNFCPNCGADMRQQEGGAV